MFAQMAVRVRQQSSAGAKASARVAVAPALPPAKSASPADASPSAPSLPLAEAAVSMADVRDLRQPRRAPPGGGRTTATSLVRLSGCRRAIAAGRWQGTSAMTPDLLIAAALLVPAATALLIPLFTARPNLREGVTLLGTILLFAAVAALTPTVLSGARPSLSVLAVVPGLTIAFAVEPLGQLFALVASALWIANSLYSIGYMRAEEAPRQTSFYVCFAVAIAATIGIAYSAQSFFAVPVLRTPHPLDLPARHPSRHRGGADRRPRLCLDAPRRLDRAPPAGDRLDRHRRRHARLHRRRHSRRQARRDRARRSPRPLRLRHRQGGGDADAPLAAGGDGRADAGLGAPPRGRGGQGRRLRPPQGRRLCLRRRHARRDRRRRLAGLCRGGRPSSRHR